MSFQFSSRTAAAFLGVPVRAVKQWAADGRLPPDGERQWSPPGMPDMATVGPYWLQETLERAKAAVPEWLATDDAERTQRRAELASDVPADVLAVAEQLMEAISGHSDDAGHPPRSLFKLHRALSRFLEFAER
jgi:hypothetical protein